MRGTPSALKSAIEIVKDILNQEDMEGSRALGAPSDEYELKARLPVQSVQRLLAAGSSTQTQGSRIAQEF